MYWFSFMDYTFSVTSKVPRPWSQRFSSTVFPKVLFNFNFYIWISDPFELILYNMCGLGRGSFFFFWPMISNCSSTFWWRDCFLHWITSVPLSEINSIAYFCTACELRMFLHINWLGKIYDMWKSYEIQVQCPEIKSYWNTTLLI